MTRADKLRIAQYERLTDHPLVEELLEVAYQQGRVDGINEYARRLGASCPKPDDVPLWAQDGFRPEAT